jgi:hypothetical protein
MNADTFKAVLTNSAPVASTGNDLTDITQISGTNGYTTGGVTLSGVAWTEPSTGTFQWTSSAFSWTASGGTMGTFQYVVIYDDTATTPVADVLVGYVDYGTTVSLTDGNTFTVTPGANGIFRVT